jgi:hypothetical protein
VNPLEFAESFGSETTVHPESNSTAYKSNENGTGFETTSTKLVNISEKYILKNKGRQKL